MEQLPGQLREGCIRGESASQKKLYYSFYGFAMGICLRYARDRDEAVQLLNTGFYKVLTHLNNYDPAKPFLPWLARIMTNTAIDHYRTEIKQPNGIEITNLDIQDPNTNIHSKLNYEDLIKIIQTLPPSYRAVFNLFAIDGYTHEEISQQLGISVGTSKSNLFKARQKLRVLLETDNIRNLKTKEHSATITNE